MLRIFDFLNNFSLQRKLYLIPLLMALPIGYTMIKYVGAKNEDVAFAEKEALGVTYLGPIKSAQRNLMRYRDLTNAAMRGAGNAESQRSEALAAVDKDLAIAEALDQQPAPDQGQSYGAALEATGRLKAIEQKWSSLKGRGNGSSTASVYNENSQLIAELQDLIVHVADTSKLTFDPAADTYYLFDATVNQIPALLENVSEVRGLAAGAAAAKSVTADDRAQIFALERQIEANLTTFKRAFDKAVEANPALNDNYAGKMDVELRELREFNTMINNQLLGPQAFTGDALLFFSRGQQIAERIRQLDETASTDLSQLLEKRSSDIRAERNWALAAIFTGIIIALAAAYLVTRGIAQQTSSILGLINDIERGNLDSRILVTSNDELGRTSRAFNEMLDNTKGLIQSRDERDHIQNAIMRLLDQVANVADGDLTAEATVTEDMTGAIADAFNFMILNLRELIGKVKEVSYQFNASTSETANFTERLAQGSQDQAERIAQTSVALTEMSAQIVRVSQTADSSAKVAEASLNTARKGAEAVSNTVEGMTRIQEQVQETSRRIRQLGERSQEIEEIVRLIEEIADRTGVLALNASIQAAAAGEAGHGFTVVANEVEELAGRSAEATKRIGSLIRAIQSGTIEAIASMEEVKREVISGARVAHSAGESLHEIETVSNELAQLVRSIWHATQQQARGSEALSNTMSQLAQLTNQTTAGVMQSALTVKNLALLADDLRASVASFKVAEHDDELAMSGSLSGAAQAALLANAAGLARH